MDTIKKLPSDASSKARRVLSVDKSLLPIKLHYFLAYGALSGALPYLPIMMKSLGIDATAVGIIYITMRLTVFFAKPCFGAITDYFKNVRCVLISLALVAVLSYCTILFVPPMYSNANDITFACGVNNTAITLPFTYNSSCENENRTQMILCEMDFNRCVGNESKTDKNHENSGFFCDSERNKTFFKFKWSLPKSSHSNFVNVSGNAVISSPCGILSTSAACSPSVNSCILPLHDFDFGYVYRTYQYWVVLVCAVVGGACFTAMFSLSDAACYETLEDRPQDFGKQRLWATVGFGLFGLLTGYLNGIKSSGSLSPDYSSGFFLMIAMVSLDVTLLLSAMNIKKSTSSTTIFKDVRRLFSSYEVIVFATGVFIVGMFCGFLWTYEFWFLQSLGATQMLFGLVLLIQCFVAEVPFFYFSGWIIQKLGRSLCLILIFAGYALRFFLYSILINPWFILPIDVIHGLTYGIFYATMTSFAKQNASHGTEATMQGLLGGLFDGLGVGAGCLLGGVGFDKIGVHSTFRWAGILSFVCIIIFSVFRHLLKL